MQASWNLGDQDEVIRVAVNPALARIEGLDQRVTGGMVMFGGMLVG